MLSATGASTPSGQGWLASVAQRNSEAISGGYSYSFTGSAASMSPIIAELRGIRATSQEQLNAERGIAASLSSGRVPPGAVPPNTSPVHPGAGGGGGFGAGGGWYGGGYGGGPGGGGGAHGGFGPGGGGGGRASHIFGGPGGSPFGGGGLLGIAGRMIARSPIGFAAEVAGAAAMMPLEIAGAVGGYVAKSQEAINFIQATSALGRAGGFPGADLRRSFGYNSDFTGQFAHLPTWMKPFGVTPQQAIGLVQGFGIRPGTAGQAVGIAGRLAELPFRPELSGLSARDLQSSAAQSARYGQVTPDAEGIVKFAQQLGPIMTRATAMGLDQSTLLRSMNSWLAVSAASGRGLMDKGQIGNYLTSFAGIVPGGNTGEFGLHLAQGLSGAADKVGRVPINTILAGSVVSKFRSEADIKAWLDKAQPGVFDKIKQNPAHSRILDAVVGSIKQGDTYFASMAFSQLVSEYPGALNAMFMNNPIVGNMGLSPAGSLVARANVANTNIFGVAASDAAASQQRLTQGPVGDKGRALALRLQKDLGLTPQGAAAVVGNFMQESSLRGGELPNGDVGFASWHKTRAAEFRAFRAAHPELSDDEASTQFFERDIQQKKYSEILGLLRNPSATRQENVVRFSGIYESPSNPQMANRMNYSASVMTRMAGPRATSTPAQVVAQDTDLANALYAGQLGGFTSLRGSAYAMNAPYAALGAASTAARHLADTLDNLTPTLTSPNSPPLFVPQ